MIDFDKEELISFKEASSLLPRNGEKKVHVSTLFRWAGKGSGGVVLETIHLGGRRYTSKEAIQRFVSQVSRNRSLENSKDDHQEPGRREVRPKTRSVLREFGLDGD